MTESFDPLLTPCPHDDPWDVFQLDDDADEPEPEYGDFWGEPDHDCYRSD